MKSCTVFRTLALGCVLFWGGLAGLRAAEKTGPADLIIFNAKVLTVDSNFTVAQAIAIRGNQIVAVGKTKQLDVFKDLHTRLLDARGATVLPGLCDSYVCSYEAAASATNSPSGFSSIADALDFIRKQAKDLPADNWIMVERTYPTRVKENRLPTLAELDAAAPKNPIYWNCGLVAMVNTKALEASKITRDTHLPNGIELALDPATRQPTGYLYNGAKLLKLPVAKPADATGRRESLKHLFQLYNQQGITCIGERRAGTNAIDLFRDLQQAGELNLRIVCSRALETGATDDETFARLDALTNPTNTPKDKLPYGPTGAGDDWVRIGALSLAMDGDTRTGTAYLRTPWGIGPAYQITDPSYRGHLLQDPDTLPALFIKAAQSGWQVAVDCTGDAALDQLVNCYEKANFKTGIRPHRFIISHATIQTKENWDICKRLGLGTDMQPAELYRDGDSLLKTLGEPRLRHYLALKESVEHGVIAGGGSGHVFGIDSLESINPWNPWLGMWIALVRQTDDGAQIAPSQKLSRAEAIKLYTINNAWLNFQETKLGSLEPGKLADLIMVDNDLLQCPVDDIRKTQVQLTLVGGKIVWEAK